MAKFSERIGVTKPPTDLQVNEINDQLRNTLWNLLTMIFEGHWSSGLEYLFFSYFKIPIDDLPESGSWCRKWLRNTYYEMDWSEVYNFIEHCLQNIEHIGNGKFSQSEFEKILNLLLERELSGYRSIKGELVPITDEKEISEIHEAISVTSKLGLDGVRQHFSNALSLLGRKPEPDYHNSIKESISAVEGICKLLTGEKSGGIARGLAKLGSKVHIHQAFKKGVQSLYDYTSDEDGIRHPILESADIGFAEAKYMLVSCSAFVNYLIDKSRQVGLL